MSASSEIVLPKAEKALQAGKKPTEKAKVPLSSDAEMPAVPAAFSLAEPMKDIGNKKPRAAYTFGGWDW